MQYMSAYHTDKGIKKRTNQDSLYLAEAQTPLGNALLTVICDGMGGLAEGELASAVLTQAFSHWFRQYLPAITQRRNCDAEVIKVSWENLLTSTNDELLEYSARRHVQLGTTAVALLLLNQNYYAIHIGDSRLYQLTDALYQLTRDQTVVQREVDLGMLTPEQAERDSRRNVLLQCVGASAIIEPEFTWGSIQQNHVFMLCSDGFRHVITPQEIWERFNQAALQSEQQMLEGIIHLTELNKYRREEDNITAILIKAA
jgi:serine/threonine protein phosphatase PrpC